MQIEKMTETEAKAALHTARKAVSDLMESHAELMKGVGAIVVDYALLNQCRLDGDGFLRNVEA